MFFVNKTFLIAKKQQRIKTFDATLLNRYYSGKFTLKFTEKNNCELIETKNFKIDLVKAKKFNISPSIFNLGTGQFYEKGDYYTIQTIGKNAFKDNKNIGQHLIIPPLIKKIGDYAFAGTKIKTIYIKNAIDFLPINENVFNGCNIEKIITRNAIYKNDQNWKKICKNDNIIFRPYKLSDYEKFLSLRTFTIGAFDPIDEKNGGFGTGWIVDKVDPENTDDYKYWMATNLHVCQVLDNNKKTPKDTKNNHNAFYVCSCKEIGGQEIEINDEMKLQKAADKKILSSSKWQQVTIETKDMDKIYNSKQDCDFYDDLIRNHVFTDFGLIKIDFMIDKNNNDQKTKILLAKLDAINKYLLLNNSLNTYTPNTAKKSTKFYGVGYPIKINNGIFNHNILNYIFQKGEIIESYKNEGKHCDFYVVKENLPSKWLLTFGSSGTMIIDENFCTIGIYWGSTGNVKKYTSDPYRGVFMFIDRFYANENNLIAKFMEI